MPRTMAPMSTDRQADRAPGTRAYGAAVIGAVLVVAAYVVDRVAAPDLSSSVAGVGRAAAILGALACAVVLYQLWSTRRANDVAHHAGVAAVLLGGALAASSAFSATSGQIFGNALTAALGIAGLAVGLVSARPGREPRQR